MDTERTEVDFAKLKKWHFSAGMYSLDEEGLKKFMSKYASDYYVNPNDWDVKQCFSVGCLRWDDHLMLLPGWVLQLLPEGFELTDIKGLPAIVGKDNIDEDTRQGLLAYGVKKEVEEKPQDANALGGMGGFDMDSLLEKFSELTGQEITGIEVIDPNKEDEE